MSKAVKKTSEPESAVEDISHIVAPSIQVSGDKEHALVKMFKGPPESLPIITSIGYMRVPGTSSWMSYVIKTKGDRIISGGLEVEEPNLRAIAEESTKTAFVTNFMDAEL